MKCSACGAECKDTAKFCTSCGSKMDVEAVGASAASDSQPFGSSDSSNYGTPSAYDANAASGNSASNSYGAAAAGGAYAGNTYNASNVYGGATYEEPSSVIPPQNAYQSTQQGTIPMTDDQRSMYLVAFVLMIVSTVSLALLIIPLAWMIPMTVHSYGIWKGKKKNTIGFAICTLLFVNLISGILYLVTKPE